MARIDERLAAGAQSRRLYAAMRWLSPSERAVLELVAMDDLSIAEVAVALGIGAVTARVRLHRARRRMADRLSSTTTGEISPHAWNAKETG